MDLKSKIILIYGPTASGKSKFGIKLAKKINGEIINADSMQIYKELKILSARPFKKDYQKIKHHLYGFVSAKKIFSTGHWLKYANQKILEVKKSNNKPINIKINNSRVTISELVRAFPSFSIDSKTFFYNDNAPEYRRKQLDRGLFIASPDYAKDWFGYFRSLKQRNSALKLGDLAQAKAYDPLLVEHGEKLNHLRKNLISEVKKIFDELVNKLVQENKRADIFSNLKINLKPGFNDKEGLLKSIENSHSAS